MFNDADLSRFDVNVFNNASGPVRDENRRAAFEA